MMEGIENISIEWDAKNIHGVDPLIPPAMMGRLIASIKAIEDVLDYESDMLEKHKNPDFSDIHVRKERAIHALNLICQENSHIADSQNKGWLSDMITPLQVKLARNERILKIHLDAVGELVEMISAAAQAREADGTYTPFA